MRLPRPLLHRSADPSSGSSRQDQAQLDALLAPIALYPDDVVRLVVDAATAPASRRGVAWSRSNQGRMPRIPCARWRATAGGRASKLVAYPTFSSAWPRARSGPPTSATHGSPSSRRSWRPSKRCASVHASGTLRSDQYQTVQPTDQGIAVVPAIPYIYYVPYCNPLVVYGGCWYPYRPVYWRPWHPAGFVTRVAVVNRGFARRPSSRWPRNGPPSPAVRCSSSKAGSSSRQQAQRQPAGGPDAEPESHGRHVVPSSASATPSVTSAVRAKPRSALSTCKATPRRHLSHALSSGGQGPAAAPTAAGIAAARNTAVLE
jgi:hypothetical protein